MVNRPLLHRLEQGRLGLGRGAVDLVGEHYVGEDRSAHEAEHPVSGGAVLLDHFGASDVGGHQIGGELDAAELQVQCVRNRGNEKGLGKTRHADQERVTIRK